MAEIVITEKLKHELKSYLKSHRKNELVTTYLFFIEKKYDVYPVIFPKKKLIYQSEEHIIKELESEGKLWRETEIKIRYGKSDVNEETTKIYICPFTGKVFGDNTNPNPQDAIYDWVSKCPENNERIDGLRVKRFLVSEDPEIIKNYITKRHKTVTKKVYSSVISGKLFNTKNAVISEFKKNYLKSIDLADVQNQNRFAIEDNFLEFFQEHLQEEKIASFIDALALHEEFEPYISKWLENAEDEEDVS